MLGLLRGLLEYVTGKVSVPGHVLCEESGPQSRIVRVEASRDAFRIDTQDMGPATEQAWGDDDYEFWTIVPREAWPKLLVAFAAEFLADDPRAAQYGYWRDVPEGKQAALLMVLAREFFADDCQATDRLAALCRKYDVTYKRGSYR